MGQPPINLANNSLTAAQTEQEKEEREEDSHLDAMFYREVPGASRLTSEFTCLQVIGKGGFGEVIKVGIPNSFLYLYSR